MSIRTEITRTIVFLETSKPKTRPLLSLIHFHQQKAFIIAKRNVVTRPVFLDQLSFEQQRLGFALDSVGLKIPRRIEHGSRL